MFRKFTIGFLTGVVLAAGLLFGAPSANAQLAVFDPANLGQMIVELGEDIARWIAEDLWRVLRDQAVKRIIDSMTDDIVNAIRNGGEPLFVSDWEGFLGRAADLTFDEFNNYLSDETGIDLCSPIRAELQVYLSFLGNTNRLGVPASCTLTRFQQNVKNSYNRLIERNGWISFKQMFNEPSNNFFGASLLIDDSFIRNAATRSQARQNEAASSGGFLSQKKCIKGQDDPSTAEDECEEYEIITPGNIAAEAATKATLRDFPYIENVQSIISAIVDKIITDVFSPSDGGGLLGGAGGSGGGVKIDTGDEDDLIDKLREIADKWASIISYFNNLTQYADTALAPYLNPDPTSRIRTGTIDDARFFCLADDGTSSVTDEHFGFVAYENEYGTRSTVRLGISAASNTDYLKEYYNDIKSGVAEGIPIATSTLLRVQDWIQLYDDDEFDDGSAQIIDPVTGETRDVLLLEVVNDELKALNDFVSDYSYAQEAISSSGTAGPGNMNGVTTRKTEFVMNSIIKSLMFAIPDSVESNSAPLGAPENNFFYCKLRN